MMIPSLLFVLNKFKGHSFASLKMSNVITKDHLMYWIQGAAERDDTDNTLATTVFKPLADVGMTYDDLFTMTGAKAWEDLPPLLRERVTRRHWRILGAPDSMLL